MPEEERPGVSDFDLPRAIVALANEPFDPMPGGMKTPETARGKLRRVVDTVEWYTWPIDAERLHARTDTTLRCHSALDRNIELKHALHARFRNALGDERERLVDYYVRTWGGINVGEDTRRRYAREHATTLADEGLTNIASRSKALVLHDPSRYAIYDSRVAVSLNYLVIRRVGYVRGYIGQKDGRKCFPLPPPRSQGIRDAHRACTTLTERFDIPFYAATTPDFYDDYLRAIRGAAWRLSESERREICIHWVESMLFGLAERCAAGLHAACRFSEPLSFTRVAGPRKAALIDSLDELGLWDGRWETPEATLEARLRRHSPEKHREFVKQHGEREAEGGNRSDETRPDDSEGAPRPGGVTPSGWRRLGHAGEPGSDRAPHDRRPAGAARRSSRRASPSAGSASDTVSASDALPGRAHRAGISCRKQHLAFVMDMNDIPWSWETPEEVLEERLRNTDPEAYRQFRRDRERA